MKYLIMGQKITIFIGALLLAVGVNANPVLDNIAAGQATVQQSPNTTVINQSSQQAIFNWQSFNIGSGEATHFIQPAGGIALNRINPQQGASQIYGQLTATGQIILINPAGIYFGPSAYVNVGGLIASTANITDQDFLNKNYQFSKVSPYSGSIINDGQIIAANHGLVALVAPTVINNGLIQANLGHVALASGDAFTMSFSGNDLVSFAVTTPISSGQGVTNTANGRIIADGGKVLISAKAAQGVLDNVINMDGIVQANSVGVRNGEIILSGGSEGIVRIAGKVSATGKHIGGKGGKVVVTGKNILLDSSSVIDVSGNTGGGNINIGGNQLGLGPLPNANAVVMMHGATLNADAIDSGNGGNIILWSDNMTKAYGSISARGGTVSGDGGFIETSSHNFLDVNNITVNTSAAHGNAGLWLLDPSDITISNAADSNITGASPFEPSTQASNSILSVTTLQNALNSGNVVVQTVAGAGPSLGDININDPFSWATTNSLTLNAYHSINLNYAGAITAGGDLNLNTNVGGSGGVISNSAANAITSSGNISLNGPLQLSGNLTLTGTAPSIGISHATTANINWNITGANSGTFDDGSSTVIFSGFSNLIGGSGTDNFIIGNSGSLSGSINGGAGSDSLKSKDGVSLWTITGLNSGTVTNIGAGFSNIENLTAGIGTSTFIFSDGQGISGNLNGGVFGGAHIIDLSAYTTPVNVILTGSSSVAGYSGSISGGPVGGVFDGISQIKGGSGDNSIKGDFINVWNITGLNSGTTFDTNQTLTFSGFPNLIASSSSGDSFILNGGTLTGSIIGHTSGGSASTITANNVPNTWTITGANAGTVTGIGGGFTNIKNLVGGSNTDNFIISGGSLAGSINGGGGTNTLTGGNIANTWNITGLNAGTVTGVTGGFSNIQNLIGGSNNDTFTFNNGQRILGTVDGGAGGVNNLNLSAYTTAVDVLLTGSNAFGFSGVTIGATNPTTGFSRITQISNGSGINSLTGDNSAINTWSITGSNAGTLNNGITTLNFSGFSNLTGGTNTDNFAINGGTLSGLLNGSAGTNTLTGDNVGNMWIITGPNSGFATGINGGFNNIQNLIGGSDTDNFIIGGGSLTGSIDGGAGINTLTGDNVVNTWNITGLNSGTVTGITAGFNNIQNIIGGSNNDNFVFSNGQIFGGTIDGGEGGVNVIDLSAYTTAVDVLLTGSNVYGYNGSTSGSPNPMISFAKINQINNGSGVNTLTGENVPNTWNITGPDTGNVNDGSATNFGFVNFANLVGGSNDDSFVINGGSLSGSINGGGGNNSLSGDNVAETWMPTGPDSGTVSGVSGGFSNIQSLPAPPVPPAPTPEAPTPTSEITITPEQTSDIIQGFNNNNQSGIIQISSSQAINQNIDEMLNDVTNDENIKLKEVKVNLNCGG